MIKINKEKIVNFLKESFNRVKDQTVKIYNDVSTDVRYIKESQQFSIIKTIETYPYLITDGRLYCASSLL